MIDELARIMDLDAHRISIKATTTEQLGFTGRGEGIAALKPLPQSALPRKQEENSMTPMFSPNWLVEAETIF